VQEYKEVLGDKFDMHVAFSRDGPEKVYVQHKMKEQAAEIDKLLQQKAFFYVCGDAANMAREVNNLLVKIIAEQRGVSEQKGEEIVKAMRASNQYQEDVWS
jgi:NADPH-ferrihemoprotein reductase